MRLCQEYPHGKTRAEHRAFDSACVPMNTPWRAVQRCFLINIPMVERVTDEAHFRDEFDMDRYDCLELMILIEDAFTGVEITDDDADQIEVVGDLIRHIEDYERR